MRRALRRRVFARDQGVCSSCGLDCLELQGRLERLEGEGLEIAWVYLESEGFKRGAALWEADHEIALDEGGADELENVVTRCRPCHLGKTKEQATRKATVRRIVGRKFLGETPKKKGGKMARKRGKR